MTDIEAIHVVQTTWCPHCHPTTVEPMEKIVGELGMPFFPYDIDIPEEAAKADELVRTGGTHADEEEAANYAELA